MHRPRRYRGRRRFALGSLWVIMACSGGEPGSSSPTEPTETPAPVLSSVSPDTLVEGADLVIRGTGFSPTPSLNVVRIDGVGATVTAATGTELSVTVPTFECRPQRTVSIQVSVSGKSGNPVSTPVRPDGFVDTAVGELLLIDEPADFCLQFPPAPAGSGEYLVGVGAAAEKPADLLVVSMTGVEGHPAPVGAAAARVSAIPSSAARPTHAPRPQARDWWGRHVRAEQRIRRWEREHLDPPWYRGAAPPTTATPSLGSGAAVAIPAVGDELPFKVPRWDATSLAGVCTPIPISTVVRVVGERGIFVTDVDNPAADALTDQDIQAFSDAFDAFVYDTDTEYLGSPSDIDENQRIFVVLTVEVNKALDGDLGGAVFVYDLFDPSVCPASDEGELYYHQVPDPINAAGARARTKDDVTGSFVPFLAHEFAHIIQFSTRLSLGPLSVSMSQWELEGQAMLAAEVAGHRALGLSPGQDYTATTAFSEAGSPWYKPGLQSLAAYYGYDFQGGRHPDAPETCTLLFSNQLAPTGCEPASGYGAAWSFFRYLADRYGPDWPGGEAGLMRDWIAAYPTLSGVANVAALIGRSFDGTFAEWAAMHYMDGRVSRTDTDLIMSSWDLQDVLTSLDAAAPLVPTARAFGSFTASVSVRGGSTAYSLFSDEAARPAVAIRVRDGNGALLGGAMRPQVWIVKTR